MPNAATAALRGGEHAHRVIRNHLDDFLRTAADRANGCCLPEFIARELREFLTCGVCRSPARVGGSARAAVDDE